MSPLKHKKYRDFANEVKQSFKAFRKVQDSLLLWYTSRSWEIASSLRSSQNLFSNFKLRLKLRSSLTSHLSSLPLLTSYYLLLTSSIFPLHFRLPPSSITLFKNKPPCNISYRVPGSQVTNKQDCKKNPYQIRYLNTDGVSIDNK